MPDHGKDNRRPRFHIGLPKALSSLRHRDYALFSVGQLISLSGNWMQNTAQGYLVYQMTGSAIYLGLVTALATIPVLFLTLPAGSLADRFPKRKLLLITQSVLLAQAFAMGILDATGCIKVWHVLALALVSGIATAMDTPARQSFTFELVGKEDLLNGIALNSSILNFTRIIGPTIAGMIVAEWGTHVCFILNAISYVAALLALILMRNVPKHGQARKEPLLKQTIEGLRYSFTKVSTRDLLIMTGVVSIFVMQYQSLMPAYARKTLGVDARGLGLLMSATGVGALLGVGAVASIGTSIRTSLIILFGLFVAPIGLLGASLSKSLHVAMFYIAIVGLGSITYMVVSNSVIQMEAPNYMRGRVMAVRTLLFSGITPIGSMLMGWIAERYSVGAAMQLGALVCAVGAVILLARVQIIFGGQTDS